MLFDASISSLVTVLTVVTIGYFFKKIVPPWKRYREQVATMQDIGCEKPHWLFGHLLTVSTTEESIYRYFSLLKQFPKCMPLWLGPISVYLQGYFPDMMKTVLGTEEPKDDMGYRFLRPWIGDGLLTSSGKKWKRNRRLLTPAFHFDILKKYLVCANDATKEMLQKWSEGHGDVEMFTDVTRMTLDNLLRSVFSKESGCQRDDNNEYLKSVKIISEITMTRLFNPLYHPDFIFFLTPAGRRYKKACGIAKNYTDTAINNRRAEVADGSQPKEALDFLDILLMSKDADGAGLSHQEICDEVNTFVFEGHDTVSSGISWAFYNLAKYPKLQDQCRKEAKGILKGKSRVGWADLNKFTFLTMFLKESMRMYPPVFSIARKTTKPLIFPRGFGPDLYNTTPTPPEGKDVSKIVPVSTNISLSILALHHNPHVWENPEEFDPQRFTQENIANRSPHAYLPFSAGPRNCIGQNFAMNEMKVALALALTRFRFLLDKDYPAPKMQPHLILRSRTGIHLRLETI